MATSRVQPVIEGYMTFLLLPSAEQESWLTRYFVLWGQRETSCARLEWYEHQVDFEDAKRTNHKRKALFVEDVATLELDKSGDEPKIILTPRTGLMINQKILRGQDVQDTEAWYQALMDTKSQLDNRQPLSRPTNLSFKRMKAPVNRGANFSVLVAETAQSRRCDMVGKACTLNIQKQGLFLKTEDENVVNHWPLRTLRKYGQADNIVTIEAGRMAPTGEGLWHFYTDRSKDVLEEIKTVSYLLLKEDDDDEDDYAELKTPDTQHNYETVSFSSGTS